MRERLDRSITRWPAALILIALAGVTIAAVAWLTSPVRSSPGRGPAQTGARIRVPMFVDPNLVRATPRFRFTFDPPEALAALRAEERLDQVIDGARDDLDRAGRLMRWARRQWEPGVPSPYPPIDARIILRDVRRGFTGGFFSQYNYVLAQALQSFGIPARYVSLVEHEVIEARLPDQGRWVCLDPLVDAWYADEQGRPLSVIEIHRRRAGGLPITPSEGHRIRSVASHMAAFSGFAVWLKNDHISSPINFTDLERYKVYFVEAGAPPPLPPGALSTSEPLDLYPG